MEVYIYGKDGSWRRVAAGEETGGGRESEEEAQEIQATRRKEMEGGMDLLLLCNKSTAMITVSSL